MMHITIVALVALVGGQQLAAADPLSEFCAAAGKYLVSEVKTHGQAATKTLADTISDGPVNAISQWNRANGHVLFGGLPNNRKAAEEAVEKYVEKTVGSAEERVVEAQRALGQRLQEHPVTSSGIGSLAGGLLRRAQNKLREIRDNGCAVVLMHDAELRRMHAQVEGLTIPLEEIPASRECLAVVTNQRLVRGCRQN